MADMVAFEEEVRRLFSLSRIERIERDILGLYQGGERRRNSYEKNAFVIRELLEYRKYLLEEDFSLNEASMELLIEFNDVLKTQLKEMRQRTISLAEKVLDSNSPEGTEVTGKCFLGYNYPKKHPVQTIRAKKIWATLNGTLDNFEPLYDDGVTIAFRVEPSENGLKYDSCNQLLWLGESTDNWNERLDRELTKDLDLTFAFHNLWDHMHFSIYDLLWVRDFNVELHVESEYNTYPDEEYDDLDWSAYDYY